jgi:hypothetical protein
MFEDDARQKRGNRIAIIIGLIVITILIIAMILV